MYISRPRKNTLYVSGVGSLPVELCPAFCWFCKGQCWYSNSSKNKTKSVYSIYLYIYTHCIYSTYKDLEQQQQQQQQRVCAWYGNSGFSLSSDTQRQWPPTARVKPPIKQGVTAILLWRKARRLSLSASKTKSSYLYLYNGQRMQNLQLETRKQNNEKK